MSSKSVTVLTVHGRRMNVKVELDMTMLEILETVCRKYNFSPEDYDLTHHNRVVDLSTMFRFSGLPNNAMLEMAAVKKARTEDDVVILLQLEDGTRPSGTFKPSDSLMHIVEVLCPERTSNDSERLIVYMRREVCWEAMSTTSLKSLGLCNGRAILRMIQRKPEAAKTQANVSVPLPPTKRENVITTVNTGTDVEPSKGTDAEIAVQTDKKQLRSHGDQEQPAPGPELSLSLPASPSNDSAKKSKTDASPTEVHKPKAAPQNTESIIRNAQIVIIGQRQALIYHASSAERDATDPDDSFFELTVSEVLQMQKQLQERVKALEEAPLMTSSLRELAQNQSILSSMTRYRQAVIRVQFPDRHILQGDFLVHETVQHIEEFVRSYLADSTMPFYLYTTPPKVVLDSKSSLLEANCFPLALLHFGSPNCSPALPPGENAPETTPSPPVCVLRPELLGQLSNAIGAAVVSARAKRAVNPTGEAGTSNSSDGHETPDDNQAAAGPSSSTTRRNVLQSTTTTDSTTTSTKLEAKILKFLKK